MNEPLPPDLPAGVPGALGTLRHALADPLSAAGLKLELLERRLATTDPDGPMKDRVRSAKADLAAAGRLINLLPRLARIAGEEPAEASISDLCRAAGLRLEDAAGAPPRLLLRRLASIDALRTLLRVLRSPEPGAPPPRVSAEAVLGRVSLRIEAFGGSDEKDPERLFHLTPGEERAEELFLARASIESDGGSLRLAVSGGRLVALLAWPRPALAGNVEDAA
jgi:hypothetical protein